MKVIVAIFREEYDHLFRLANVDYQACVSAAELARWKDTVARVLTESQTLECKRATPYDQSQMAKAIATAKSRMSEADVRIARFEDRQLPATIAARSSTNSRAIFRQPIYGVKQVNSKLIEPQDGKNVRLEARANWQTRARGDNESEYRIYVDCVSRTGQPVKTYEEWLAS